MAAFAKVRLEGKALEDALAGKGGSSVRMLDESSGKWVQVKTEVAKAATRYMAGRSKELVEQLSLRGFLCSSGDMPATLHQQDVEAYGKQVSVDLYMWCQAKAEHALVEVKWGRGKFKAVRKRARGCIPKLKAASLRGR